jgi:enamine deaminase RidA (YjgF/YER057c/UK114 family)
VKTVRISTGTKWEPIVGYSRAVRIGNVVAVTGTTATGDDGEIVGEGDLYLQSKRALENIRRALERIGARVDDVIRTRIFVTDISRWEEAGRAHGEMFGKIRPATSMIEISRLIDPRMLVEIEADAIISRAGPRPVGGRSRPGKARGNSPRRARGSTTKSRRR